MNEPENFLSRWSRRKREATGVAPDTPDAASPGAVHSGDASAGAVPPPADRRTRAAEAAPSAPRRRESGDPGQPSSALQPDVEAEKENKPAKTAEPEFDLSTLPPIESITAETDIRQFLAPGVPPALTQAALRRAWVIDPKIRDFIEMAENQWDFTAPGVPGFDLSPPAGDVARMVSGILRGMPDESAPQPAAASVPEEAETEAAPREISSPPSASHRIVNEPLAARAPTESAAREPAAPPVAIGESEQQVAASQNDNALQNEDARKRHRPHGRAIPR